MIKGLTIRWPARPRAILYAMLGAGLLLAGRLVELQVVHHDALFRRANVQGLDTLEIPGPRGDIYDRQERMLAMSIPVNVLAVEPQKMSPGQMHAIEEAAGVPGRLAGKDDARWVIVRRDCDRETREAVEDLVKRGKVPKDAVYWEPGFKRYYPNGVRAAHILGFVTLDGASPEGVEKVYERLLRSEGTKVRMALDARREPMEHIAGAPFPTVPPALMLTIDLRLQEALEQALAKVTEEAGAKGAEGLVLDPRTGEVLALAAWPAYDLNTYNKGLQDLHRNRAIEQPFEPGSVMKPFTASALVEAGLVNEVETVNCEFGKWHVSKSRTISDVAPHGALTLPEVIQYSSNIGIVKFSRRLTGDRFHDTLAKLGFGERTGIDLPAENPGKLIPAARMQNADKDTVAFGHTIMVTPLQLAAAVGTIANGGVRVKPRVARAWGAPHDWELYDPAPGEQRLARLTADTVSRWMRRVVDEPRATGKRAAIAGYGVAGKTGTAEKLTGGHYDKTKNIASFVGFAPSSAPQAVCVISVDEPRLTGRTGGVVAAPVFAQVMGEALRLTRVPPDRPEDPMLLKAKAEQEKLLAIEEPESAPTAGEDPEPPAPSEAGPATAKPQAPPQAPPKAKPGLSKQPAKRKPAAKPTAPKPASAQVAANAVSTHP